MSGIYGVFLKDQQVKSFHRYFSNCEIQNERSINQSIYQFLIGRSVIDKLANDRFFETRNGITICFEGVNLSEKISHPDSFFEYYQTWGVECIKSLKGNFCGFIVDEQKEEIHIFNDHLASRNIFYYYDAQVGFVFSSELKSITKLFRELNIPLSLDRDAVYMMALYGFILENHTYATEVKKLSHSSVISYNYDKNEIKINQRFFYKKDKIKISLDQAAETVNILFEKSVQDLWGKDLEYSDGHLSFLSGGMDAKANILIAKNLGFKNFTTITFGQSASSDVKYANSIAVQENFNHFQRFLDYPKYLVEDVMKNYIEPLDGLMMYHSSAHASSTIRSFNLEKYSLLHTGQLGDSLFGSFTKPGFNFKQQRHSIGYTGNVIDGSLLDKIEMLPEFLRKYQDLNYDLFNIEQRQMNATLNGDRALNAVIDNVSPFTDLELMEYCLSLPDEFKKNQILYFKWLSKYHKNVVNYPWENIQMKPNHALKVKYGKIYKKYFNGAKKYFHLNYDSMNPYGVWMKKYPFILQTLDQIFEEEITSSYLDQELKSDLRQVYNQNVFEYRNKYAVITALLALKLHFKDGCIFY